jgi:primary-amine oxidase
VLQDVQAGISPDEYVFVEQLTKAYKPLRDAIAKRGLDPEGIAVDAWCCGHTGPDCDPIERICWPSMFYRDPAVDDLIYARPIEGIDIRISLTKKEVIRFSDTGFSTLPIPASNESFLQNYIPVEHQRKDLKPIIITQPEGPSWTVTSRNVVDWQGWKFQVGFNSREGLTLHGITYANRPILHRMSICEMVVPYGDPRSPHCLKNAFDAGEDGLGRNANSLVLGCDCLGYSLSLTYLLTHLTTYSLTHSLSVIKYFDANLVRDNGDVFIIKNAICMHEEDHGLGWKHTDWRTSIPYSTRSRRLALSFVCTIANYEYGFFFYFYLDGTVETEVKLTGILSTGSLSYEEYQAGGRKYGINLGGHLYAPVHQHLFLCKMDFVVDGTDNRVVEYNVEADSTGPHNPSGNGFYYTETLLDTELGTDCCAETARFWKIQSGSKVLTHSLTHSLTNLLTHSLTNLLTHSLTHLLTHSLTHSVQ